MRRKTTWAVFLGLLLIAVIWAVRMRAQPKTEAKSEIAANYCPDQSGAEMRPDFMFPEGSIAGVVEGNVTDEQGRPVAGAVVSIAPRLIGTKGYRERFKDKAVSTVRTDALGHYRAERVRPGILSVVASAPHFLPARVQPVKLMPEQADSMAD